MIFLSWLWFVLLLFSRFKARSSALPSLAPLGVESWNRSDLPMTLTRPGLDRSFASPGPVLTNNGYTCERWLPRLVHFVADINE